ncbi:MAG: M24 family metallopeptidase [Deltaproteobacteria bacterium]|jgi:Xaa-Pro aminopeptidase|nr:M24 family metallopeptidase [Deltaproteobacteria bacterium]
MSTTLHLSENLPARELELRWQRCRALMDKLAPEAGGLMVFSPLNIYYFTGIMNSGLFWLPREGKPLLALRKGADRAALEAPALTTVSYRSYAQATQLLAGAGCPLTPAFLVEDGGLTWSQGQGFAKSFKDSKTLPGDALIARARSVKTPYELAIMRETGKRHYQVTCVELPRRIKPGMSEEQIGRELVRLYLDYGHHLLARVNSPALIPFIGTLAAGENGCYPTYSNGILGFKGLHPASPYLGDPGTVWQPESVLILDCAFVFEGYLTDKSQLYFSGSPGKMPEQARRAQACAIAIETAMAARLKPGAIPEEIWQAGRKMAAEAGFAENFMGLGAHQQPFLGHGVGMCMDETPVFANRFTDPLEEGMVMALEPKFALPGIGMVGVENNFIVTPRGGESITTRTPDLKDDNGDCIFIE